MFEVLFILSLAAVFCVFGSFIILLDCWISLDIYTYLVLSYSWVDNVFLDEAAHFVLIKETTSSFKTPRLFKPFAHIHLMQHRGWTV